MAAPELIPAIVQDAADGRVLMLAWMDEEALRRTRETGEAWFWSRSRGRLWRKGEQSGNTLAVEELRDDCDGDADSVMLLMDAFLNFSFDFLPDKIGGLMDAPLELVRCESSDLLVPAQCEIVVEGEVLPDCVGLEGPYGEYPGYRTGEMGNGILFRAAAVTHRKSPILTVDATGYRDDSSTITALTGAIAIKRRLDRHGVPVLDVNVPRDGAVHTAVIAVKYGGGQVARQILETLTSRRALLSKILLVEPDVDVFDLGQVLHAFSTKCHPVHGIHTVQYEGRANTLTPCYSQGERAAQKGATVLYDCTWPGEWSREWEVPVKATFETIFPASVRQKVLSQWRAYGFKE